VTDIADAAGAMRRRLLELAEDQRWFHHVADLDTGETATATLDRPVAPLSRADRLSRVAGHRFDTTIFGGPTYRLSPQHPYQASPEGWMEVSQPTYYAPGPGGNLLWWEPPRDFDPRHGFLGLVFTLTSVPTGQRSVASLALTGHSVAGTVGHVQIQAQLVPTPVVVPVDASFGVHTVDFTFVPPQGSVEIVVALFGGIEVLTFNGMTFGPAPLVLDPGVFARDS
jgi:hypothetical protein